MNTKSTLFTVGAAVLLSAGGMFAYFYFIRPDTDTTEPKSAVDLPLDQVTTRSQQSNSSLEVKSAQNAPTSTQNQLPQPNDFSVYEQYANAQTVQYIDTVVGTGETAEQGTTAYMLYQGYLSDGTLFDQSRTNELNQLVAFPFTLGAGQVIQGWEQGVAGMKEGGKRRMIIPSQLGYGASGTSDGSIPPNALLIFDVELVQVDQAQTTP